MVHLHRISSDLDNYIDTVEMKSLVTFIVENNDSYFLDVLHQALLYCREHQDYIKSFDSFKKRMSRRREKVDYTVKLLELLDEVLNLSNEQNHYPTNRKPFSKIEAYRYVRGAILEAIVIETVGKLRFTKEYDSWEDDCEVQRLPGKETICFYYTELDGFKSLKYKKKENIDLAAWSANRGGEFYECKLSPNGFKKENIEYLQQIYYYIQEVDERLLCESSFGGITLDTTEQLEVTVRIFDKQWFVPVGRDRLFELSEARLLL